MADPIKTIGQKLKKDGPQQRDAIHIAVLSVVSDEQYLRSGEPIKLVYGSANLVRSAAGTDYGEPGIGIVDPFNEDMIKRGDHFWMFMRPGTVANLHHQWTHPAVDNPGVIKSESEKWLRDFADRWHFEYDRMIQEAIASSEERYDHYITARGGDLHDKTELGEDYELFWYHLETMTGKKFDEAHREHFGWSCSC